MTTDPFESLYDPIRAVDPDPAFAAALRARLQRAILDPSGATMASTEAPPRAQTHSLTPYLAVPDARGAIDFYVDVLGAVQRGDPIVMPDGRVGHAELVIGDSVLMLAEEFPEYEHVAPLPGGPAPSYNVAVADVDRTVERAVAQGSRLLSPVSDTEHGRSGTVVDPFGHRWIVSAAPEQADDGSGPRHGEAGYFTFTVADDEAAKQFYGAVLGWRFSPGSVERGWNIEGTGLAGAGLWGGQQVPGWRLMYAVDDLTAAAERVRANGGQASEPKREPYGLMADCTDNQGIEFWLWQARG